MKEDNFWKGVFFVFIVIVVLICAVAPSFATSTPTSGAEQTNAPIFSDDEINAITNIAPYILAALFVVWCAYKILSSEMAIPFIAIIGILIVVLSATYIFIYGDKNGDGQGDTQMLAVVQPVGDPTIDTQYANINSTNTKTNLISMASIVLYIFTLLVASVVATGIGILLHYRKIASERK